MRAAAGESAVPIVEAGRVIAVLSRNTKKVDIFSDSGGGLAQSLLAQIGCKRLRYLITPTCLVQNNRNCLLYSRRCGSENNFAAAFVILKD